MNNDNLPVWEEVNVSGSSPCSILRDVDNYPAIPDSCIPVMPNAGLIHKEKTITITHSDLKLAISKAFRQANIDNDHDKEICISILFETFRSLNISYQDLFKLLNSPT